jgi:hypothetical protein
MKPYYLRMLLVFFVLGSLSGFLIGLLIGRSQ